MIRGVLNPFCARSEGVITPPCHGGDRRFKSGRARQENTLTFLVSARQENTLTFLVSVFSWLFFRLEPLTLCSGFYIIPIHHIPPSGDIIVAFVFIVKVVGVLPHI